MVGIDYFPFLGRRAPVDGRREAFFAAFFAVVFFADARRVVCLAPRFFAGAASAASASARFFAERAGFLPATRRPEPTAGASAPIAPASITSTSDQRM